MVFWTGAAHTKHLPSAALKSVWQKSGKVCKRVCLSVVPVSRVFGCCDLLPHKISFLTSPLNYCLLKPRQEQTAAFRKACAYFRHEGREPRLDSSLIRNISAEHLQTPVKLNPSWTHTSPEPPAVKQLCKLSWFKGVKWGGIKSFEIRVDDVNILYTFRNSNLHLQSIEHLWI